MVSTNFREFLPGNFRNFRLNDPHFGNATVFEFPGNFPKQFHTICSHFEISEVLFEWKTLGGKWYGNGTRGRLLFRKFRKKSLHWSLEISGNANWLCVCVGIAKGLGSNPVRVAVIFRFVFFPPGLVGRNISK